jgi:hypothetical protein
LLPEDNERMARRRRSLQMVPDQLDDEVSYNGCDSQAEVIYSPAGEAVLQPVEK